ncbi:MAG: exodeoxyribonuclease V subunit beta [Thermomonas sp.]|uniref:UvrD-helicase domain-containing protein n=1 Tax=Thermomonas sp. TaxID=1971895 RepID=UPI0039E6D992
MSNAVFDTPLDACSLVEASAGTGKTFALAGLFVRAVIERRLAPQQILAVTFTKAATQELRARVALRLQQAAMLAADWQADDPPEREGDNAETALLRRMLHTTVSAGESPIALRLRLARAARDLDLAQIATIHGFCQRVLAEHALDAGQMPGETGIETSLAPARRQLALALWREYAGDAEQVAFLRRHFGDVDGLRKALGDLLSHEPMLPQKPERLPPDPRLEIAAAWQALCQRFVDAGDETRDALLHAIAAKTLKNNQYKPEHIASLWNWFSTQARSSEAFPHELHDKLAKLTPAALLDGTSNAGAGKTPQSLLFDAIAAFLMAHAPFSAWQEASDLQRLHSFRARAKQRNDERKAALQLRDYDDLIGALHAAVKDDATRAPLARALRAQYRLALVDEFQDTDARQWEIFRALFAEGDGGLVLVGDPKQAIYRFRGGDVHTYVEARQVVQRDDIRLERNFRSRPLLLSATNAVFAGMPAQALGEGIDFTPVQAGEKARDDDLQSDGTPAAPLAFHAVPPRIVDGKTKDWTKDESIEHAAALCAEAIRVRLQQARDGHLQRRDGNRLRPLEPRDCAVLVRTHAEGVAVRHALAQRNVPAASVDRRSLYASDEASELLTLLLALLQPADAARTRAALATPLFGLDADALAALADDGETLRIRQHVFNDWRARWQDHGPQAMLTDVVAAETARLLGLENGERRIANLLQLGELLQQAATRSLGLQGQVDWLQGVIASPDDEDEAQLPRLESDADRVQIMTLHKSKGLEFPLVFLPFVGIGRDDKVPKLAVFHHHGQRVRQWKTEHVHGNGPTWDQATTAHKQEDHAEDMRLLYVGITRAREALWLCGGALASNHNTALHRLLGGNTPSSELRAVLGDQLMVSEGLPPEHPARLPVQATPHLPPARTPTRTLQRDWWMHSFSQLHRQAPHGQHALHDETPADDERDALPPLPAADPRFAGARFGNVLHHALEHADFNAWREGDDIPGSQHDIVLRAFAAFGYRDDEAREGLPLIAPLIARTLQAQVPGIDGNRFRLCDLDPRARLDEMEFHFALRGTRVDELLAVLHAHGVLPHRHGFGAWQALSGLMTGKIDLTCRIDGRFYVIDYKTNRLPAYDAPALAQAMQDAEYDWQALLYAVALQRWLRAKLGRDYDFARHIGGVRYLFCRGLDPAQPGHGMHALPFTRELVDAVDAVLATPLPGATQ